MDVHMGGDDALVGRKYRDFISRSRYQGSGEIRLCMVVVVAAAAVSALHVSVMRAKHRNAQLGCVGIAGGRDVRWDV
jgi:hypothetical protein